MKNLILFVFALLPIFFFNSCNFPNGEPPGDTSWATIKMYNKANYPVHLFTTGEDFNSENKVEPGASRSSSFITWETLENDDNISYIPFDVVVTAGSGGQVIATKTLVIGEHDARWDVYFNGTGFD